MNEDQLLSCVRKRQRQIERFVLTKLLPKVRVKSVQGTAHFREWRQLPMNYARIIELPLTYELLDLHVDQSILDMSSPKLLSLYLAMNDFHSLTISDIEDYFVNDFEIFSKVFGIHYAIEVFDAREIPFPNETFDRVFSVSVLEHIPESGDTEVVKEVSRILKPGGVSVITLPAFKHYLEEWLKSPTFCWKSVQRKDGSFFYHRRYDVAAIQDRFGKAGLTIEDVVFVAERPIKKPELNQNGMLLHNFYYLEDLPFVKCLRRLSRTRIPLLRYISHRHVSMSHHYLTRNQDDESIRQVAVKLRKG